jgi:CheY-like chemotaxis protein
LRASPKSARGLAQSKTLRQFGRLGKGVGQIGSEQPAILAEGLDVSVRPPAEMPANSAIHAPRPAWHCSCNSQGETMKSIRDKNILIADDDEGMLRALDKVLTAEGAIVTTTKWAVDAIEILIRREKPVDLVITDLRMPFVTGMTLVYAVHQIFPSLPVMVLTAFGSPELKAECLRQGAAAFLEKPLDTKQFLTAIGIVFAAVKSRSNGARSERAVAIDVDCEEIEPQKVAVR